MDFGILIAGLKAARDKAMRSRREENARFHRALTKLSNAVTETRIILGRQKRQPITYEDKERLSRLWASAGIAISEFDHDLALRCDIKGSFWADPERWTDEQIDDANIRIVAMERELRELFSNTRRTRRRERTDGK
jgi:hypothetical protein